ncbi:MAG: LuxR C-terminal-related transcriptional regulator [Nevskiales bacterium]|nr:LuxR C-terminal-related transcriptional regulator [Nevskiales bacterium]
MPQARARRSSRPLPESLITTKLNPPELDPRVIWRNSLFERTPRHPGRKAVTSIVAAAGSGKSTLMAQMCAAFGRQGVSTCWISLDRDDDSPAAFAAYFISALGSLDLPGAERELSLQRANPARDFEALFDNLVARITALPHPASIFLDDFQCINAPQIIRFLNKLIAHAPATVQLVIASRTELPLDLARLRVADELVEITQTDLNFDPDQASVFLERAHDLKLEPADLETLLSTTEGWPTGLQLAGLALRRHQGPARDLIGSFSGRDKDLTRYLVETVLSSQPPNVRQFLLRTAPLRRMSPQLCEAASGHHDADEMLTYLARSNLFVIALDRNGQWYRYHHLFAEFLQNELRRGDPRTYEQVCEQAAQWCEANGHTTEAIQYALDSRNFEKAADLIAERAPMVSQAHGDHYTILDWMRRLPEPYHERRPQILLSHAWSRAFSRDAEQAIGLTDRVLQRLRGNDDSWALDERERRHSQLLAYVIQAISKACSDEIENCIERSVDLRNRIPDDEPFLIASICNCLSYAYMARRQFDDAVRTAADGYLYGHRANAAYATVWADFLHGLADVELGRLRTAQEHGRRAERAAGAEHGAARSYSASLAALLNAEIAAQRCEFEQVQAQMDIARSFTALFGPVEPLLIAIRNEARIHAWAGRPDAARKVLMQGQDMALSTGQPRLFLNLAAEEATLRLWSGDVDGALESTQRTGLFERCVAAGSADGTKDACDAIQLLSIRLLLAQGDTAGVIRKVNLLQQSPRLHPNGSFGLMLRSLRAAALWQSGRQGEAVREFDRVLACAAPEFHAYPIAVTGSALLPVLRAIESRRGDTAQGGDLALKRRLEQWLLSLMTGDPGERSAPHPTDANLDTPIEALTEREAELLRLVEAGFPNRQLADALLITEATVKWHLHNIYGKIGVRNRTAAAARARELMLI